MWNAGLQRREGWEDEDGNPVDATYVVTENVIANAILETQIFTVRFFNGAEAIDAKQLGDALDVEYNEECDYKIVGSTEANSLKGKISNESQVGKALIGKKVGDTVTVETQVGELEYKVLSIHRSN